MVWSVPPSRTVDSSAMLPGIGRASGPRTGGVDAGQAIATVSAATARPSMAVGKRARHRFRTGLAAGGLARRRGERRSDGPSTRRGAARAPRSAGGTHDPARGRGRRTRCPGGCRRPWGRWRRLAQPRRRRRSRRSRRRPPSERSNRRHRSRPTTRPLAMTSRPCADVAGPRGMTAAVTRPSAAAVATATTMPASGSRRTRRTVASSVTGSLPRPSRHRAAGS